MLSPRLKKWAIVVALMGAAAVIVGLGIFARNTVLKANPCEMTYSKREKTELNLCGKNCEYKLWKITNPTSKALNPQPVLYIPGHLGSANQARSLASYMHDENAYFQYFALDFNEGFSALHGSDIFAQAHITNVAIEKIVRMYCKKSAMKIDVEDRNSTRKVMLVGHSVGGVVAKAAALLSNHPSCAVRDIIQLSSPNVRPSYSPDASLETAYNLINQAWNTVYRNSSGLHSMCAGLTGAESNTTTQFGCPSCIASMRLVSFTGGEMDFEVPSELSDLNKLFPAPVLPKIYTPAVITPQPTSWYFRLIKGAFNSVVGGARSFITSAFAPTNATVTATVNPETTGTAAITTAAVETSVPERTKGEPALAVEVAVVEADGTASTAAVATAVSNAAEPAVAATTPLVPISDPVAAMLTPAGAITAPGARQMPPTVQFLSLRSSQLKSVGFPIDHAAVVWCYDLLHVITAGMQRMSKTTSASPVVWSEVFPLEASQNLTHSTASAGTYEQHFHYRRQAAINWAAAAKQEHTYIADKLPWSRLLQIPFAFVSNHLLKVMVCYLLISCFVLAAPLLRTLTGVNNETGASASCWDMLLPWNHLSVDTVHAVAFSAVKTNIPPTLWLYTFTVFYQFVAFVVALKAAYEYFFTTFDASAYAAFVHWTVAYFAALLVRAAILVVVQSIQWVCALVWGVNRAILRMTIWNKTIRTSVRGLKKSLGAWCEAKLPFYAMIASSGSLALSAILAVWMTVFITARQHVTARGTSMSQVTFGLSVLTIVAYAVLCLALLAALVSPVPTPSAKKSTTKSPSPYHVDLLLLYLPAPLLALPSLLHAARLLYGTGAEFPAASALFSVFDLDRALCVLSLATVAAHLWAARLSSYALPARVKALRWMHEVVGPQALLDYTDLFGATYTESLGAAEESANDANAAAGDSGKGLAKGCLHEDGGKYAVFEEVLVTDQGIEKVEVAKGVVLGSTYRVVSCNCAKDTSLADQTEFCSYCRCRKCGGKHLPPERGRYYTHSDAAEVAGLADFSSDLLPLLALPAVGYLGVVYLQRSPYAYLYLLALTAGAFLLREISYARRGGKQ